MPRACRGHSSIAEVPVAAAQESVRLISCSARYIFALFSQSCNFVVSFRGHEEPGGLRCYVQTHEADPRVFVA